MATRTTPNPLDAYVTTKPGDWARDFKLPPMPSLRNSLSGRNVLDAAAAHDQALEQWRINAEQSISERLRQVQATTTTVAAATTPTTTVTTPSPAPSVAIAPVTSVNGKVGAVTLNTDDIAEGIANLYLTVERWMQMFDHLGFHVNDIPAGDAIYVPPGRNLVITGPLTVEGNLTVDGHFSNVTPPSVPPAPIPQISFGLGPPVLPLPTDPHLYADFGTGALYFYANGSIIN